MQMSRLAPLLLALLIPVPLAAVTVTVDTAADDQDAPTGWNIPDLIAGSGGPDGTISLREAIRAAEITAGGKTVQFSIPLSDPRYDPARGQWVITPGTHYVGIINGSLAIDGDSQARNRGDTNPDGPEILIDGAAGHLPFGIAFGSDDNTLLGVEVTGCVTGINLSGARGNSVSGITSRGNLNGIHIDVSSSDNVIGPGNVVTDNQAGVLVTNNSQRITITRNLIYNNASSKGWGGADILIESGCNGGVQPPSMRFLGDVFTGLAPGAGTVEVFGDLGDALPHYLGSSAAGEDGRFGLVSPSGNFARATFTDELGNTSTTSPLSPSLVLVSNSGTDEEPGNTVSAISGPAFASKGTIEVGLRPEGIYPFPSPLVVNNDSDTLTKIDVFTLTPVGTVPVPEEPLAITVDGPSLFLISTGPDPETVPGTLTLMERDSYLVKGAFAVGRRPATVVLDPDRGVVAIPNLFDDTISVFDIAANAVTRTIAAGDYPSDVCFGRDGLIYVANIGNGRTDCVSAIDYGSGATVGSVFTGLGPISIVRQAPYVAVANSLSDTVSIVDERDGRIVRQIPVGAMPTDLALVDGMYLFVTNFLSSVFEGRGTVSVISLADLSIVGEIEVGAFPNHVGIMTPQNTMWFGPGGELAASPTTIAPGGSIAMGYVIEPGLLSRADVLLGVEIPGGTILAFDSRFGPLRPIGPIASIPRVARNLPFFAPASGTLMFSVPSDSPAGTYRFVAGILRPGTSTLSQVVYSNAFGF